MSGLDEVLKTFFNLMNLISGVIVVGLTFLALWLIYGRSNQNKKTKE